LHVFPPDNVAFDNAPNVMVDNSVIRASPASFSEEAGFTSMLAASVSAPESIVASAEASLPSQVEEVASPSLADSQETPADSEPVASSIEELPPPSLANPSETPVEPGPVATETVAPPADAEEASAIEEEEELFSTSASEIEGKGPSSTSTPEIEEASTSLESLPSESASSSSSVDDPIPSSTSFAGDELIDSELVVPPVVTEDASPNQSEDQEYELDPQVEIEQDEEA
jgi:hypothetical protein